MTLHTHIATEFQNAGPGFNKDIPCMAFVGVPFSFDASATDADGDSLVYELKTPFAGGSLASPQPIPASPPPFEIVSYILPQFSEGNMLGGNSSFTIDPETGEMTAIPVFEGKFQTGYLVKEFKRCSKFGLLTIWKTIAKHGCGVFLRRYKAIMNSRRLLVLRRYSLHLIQVNSPIFCL